MNVIECGMLFVSRGDAEGVEVIVNSSFQLYFTLPTSRFLLRPTESRSV